METLRQILILGGIYFIISFSSGIIYGNADILYDVILFLPFFVCFVILCLKGNLLLLQKIEKKFPKVSIYLLSLGIILYFEIIVISVPGILYGYNSAMAAYNNMEYVSIIPLYMDYAIYVYYFFTILVILGATYFCFFKKQKKNG